ncbi:hypothetical protein DFH08DRAFT_941933 [Mycena albidolilacea]|uniref:Uncharacterized protein n=1 Tax=Mycena albidolilacea TaxID=1033008 RepID=A0AAD6ZFV5_9AGAR|nr:hypothetical protein DFH08DRAFT_941933 [Mycena albidolilacea]
MRGEDNCNVRNASTGAQIFPPPTALRIRILGQRICITYRPYSVLLPMYGVKADLPTSNTHRTVSRITILQLSTAQLRLISRLPQTMQRTYRTGSRGAQPSAGTSWCSKRPSFSPGKIGAKVDARGKDDPKRYPNSAGGTGDADDGKERHARGYGGRIPATSCAGASSVFTRERHPAANPPYSWRAGYMLATPHRWGARRSEIGARGGEVGKPSASFADGAEGKRIPPGGGGRRRDSARNPRPWTARCAGGLNADAEFRTLGDIPKRKSSLPTHPRRMSVGTPCGPEGRIRLPVVIPLSGEDRVRAEWDASVAIGEKAVCAVRTLAYCKSTHILQNIKDGYCPRVAGPQAGGEGASSTKLPGSNEH